MPDITASLVVYKTPFEELAALVETLQSTDRVAAWVVVDNASEEDPDGSRRLQRSIESLGGRYVSAGGNIGFGAGHNLALRSLKDIESNIHLMVNPDITLDGGALDVLAERMYADPSIGLILPRILYEDGRDQYLAKLLPTPLDFALRRFAPGFIQRLAGRRLSRYELRELASSETTAIPFLSGCFMFTRRKALEEIGGFDETFFLYLEDVDLCRRLAAVSTLLYCPSVRVLHAYQRGAHRDLKLMLTFLRSSVLYFTKWGWIFDKGRREANQRALRELEIQSRRSA